MDSICVGCGLCCDGSMYLAVHLQDGDPAAKLRAAGFTLVTRQEQLQFDQPCRALTGGACGIYDGRPHKCREYRCRLLRRHEAGHVTREAALGVIRKATGLRDRVRSEIVALTGASDDLPLPTLCRRLLEWLEAAPDPTAAKRRHGGLLLEVGALRIVLAREFDAIAQSSAPAGLSGTSRSGSS